MATMANDENQLQTTDTDYTGLAYFWPTDNGDVCALGTGSASGLWQPAF